MPSTRFCRAGVLVLLCLLQASCLHVFRKVEVVEFDPAETSPVVVQNALKVHLNNGETVIFDEGAVLLADSIRSQHAGRVYGISQSGLPTRRVRSVSLTDVAAVEAFRSKPQVAGSIAVSTLATAVTVYGSLLLYKALFGSCPTVYSELDGREQLEAEAFPSSIAPLFESRDVDRISARPDETGRLRLSVRNEALETHYINHIELVETTVAAGEMVVPDRDGRAVALRDFVEPGRLTDRRGNDVTALLAHADSMHYKTAQETIDEADSTDLWDYVYLSVPAAQLSDDTVFVYLRLNNSLFGTVYFYDSILKHQGPNAVKWLADDLEYIGEALRLANFYATRMGLRIDVLHDGSFEEVGRVREVGPIAMDHVAVPIPVWGADSLRIRLRFIADAWRIDELRVAASGSYPETRVIPVSRVSTAADPIAGWTEMISDGIATPDEEYGVTGPGQSFDIEFETGVANGEGGRSYILAMQGYYVEWMRGEWLRENPLAQRFIPTEASIERTLRRWSEVKDEYEALFFATRVPTTMSPVETSRQP